MKQHRDYFVGLLVCKSLNNLLPDYITDKFTMTNEIACRSTKSTLDNKLFCQQSYLYIFT